MELLALQWLKSLRTAMGICSSNAVSYKQNAKAQMSTIGEGVDYKGSIDATNDPEPSTKTNGDFYVNTGAGTSTITAEGISRCHSERQADLEWQH